MIKRFYDDLFYRLERRSRDHLHPSLHHPHSLQDLDQVGGQKSGRNHLEKAQRRICQAGLINLTRLASNHEQLPNPAALDSIKLASGDWNMQQIYWFFKDFRRSAFADPTLQYL